MWTKYLHFTPDFDLEFNNLPDSKYGLDELQSFVDNDVQCSST